MKVVDGNVIFSTNIYIYIRRLYWKNLSPFEVNWTYFADTNIKLLENFK